LENNIIIGILTPKNRLLSANNHFWPSMRKPTIVTNYWKRSH